jgi:hypothetical protein
MASSSLGDFAERMKKRASTMESGVSKLVRKVALTVQRDLVLATPVDTGRARSNWQVSVGGPSTGELEAYSPGKGGSSAGPNAQAAIAAGEATIAKRQPGQDIFIQNNLPYIGRLNEGWSAQAPAGFVEASIKHAEQVVRQTKVID